MTKSYQLCATAQWVSTIVILLSVSCYGNVTHVEHPVTHPVEHPVTHPVEHPVTHPVTHPVEHPVEHPVTHHPVEHPVTHPVEHPVEHPVTHPVEHPVTHPVEHPVTHPVEHPVEHPVHYSESDAAKYLEKANQDAANWTSRVVRANWNWSTNMSDHNAMEMFKLNAKFGMYMQEMNKDTMKYLRSPYKDPNITRQLKLFSAVGIVALPEDRLQTFDSCIRTMKDVFINLTLPEYRKGHAKRNLDLENDLISRVATTTDAGELKHLWLQWSEKTGEKVRPFYSEYVHMSNEGAVFNKFNNTAHLWINKFEDAIFRKRIERLWNQIKPLYVQVHAYVRRKLWERYGDSVISRRGTIPSHLLGDMWTQSWERLINLTMPYPDVKEPDLTSVLRNQNYTPKKMFEVADNFMMSLNLTAMPHSFWEESIMEKPTDREILCRASVWDFYNGKDFRIKQCSTVSAEDFFNAHRVMGVVHYYLEYRRQPYIYRDGAAEGFQEAIGETIALSATTPKHLHKIGLLPKTSSSPEADINYLYKTGLNKITFLPFAYVMDLWRWNVFDGTTEEDNYNCDWWELRYKYQGLEPPVVRSEDNFDPGSKLHIAGNVPYITYFMSFILQFQLHQSLCEKAGQFDPYNSKYRPLYKCDIYQNTNAGNALREMMKLGKSKHWLDVLDFLTGKRQLDAIPMLNYFQPLYDWLENENNRTGEFIGWESNRTMCVRSSVVGPIKHAKASIIH